jgi:hypothetical protein
MSFSTPPVVDRQTFYASQSAVAVALNKSMLSISNGASGKVLKIQNIFIVNSQITAVVGSIVQFDLLRTTSITPFAQVMPEQYRDPSDAVKAYRACTDFQLKGQERTD